MLDKSQTCAIFSGRLLPFRQTVTIMSKICNHRKKDKQGHIHICKSTKYITTRKANPHSAPLELPYRNFCVMCGAWFDTKDKRY